MYSVRRKLGRSLGTRLGTYNCMMLDMYVCTQSEKKERQMLTKIILLASELILCVFLECSGKLHVVDSKFV